MIQLLIVLLCTLPRIDLTYTTLDTDTFNTGTFRFTDSNDTISLNMLIRHRGASSLSYDKYSYAIKLCDSLGNSVDTTFLGMRKDNYWILDAMASDKARMRNRVSMDLWLEFSRKPWYQSKEPDCVNGYRGHMVEVYLNNQPQGIYHFMERVDRKQLKVKKYSEKNGIRGVLYKNVKYSLLSRYWIDYRNPMPSDTAVWDGYEQKHPDVEDGEPVSWTQLHHHVTTCVNTPSATYPDSIETHLDIPVFVDYILFTQLLSARDNMSKNLYLSIYSNGDERMLYTPWDLDHSWGRRYNGDIEDVDAQVAWDQNYLYKRMVSYYHLKDTLCSRYAELRSYYFSLEHITSLFEPYFDLYAASGLDTLEQQLWSGHDITFTIADEQDYIHDWVEARLAYLDNLYHYSPVPTAIGTAHEQHNNTSVVRILDQQTIYIKKGEDYFDLYGRRINLPLSTTMP